MLFLPLVNEADQYPKCQEDEHRVEDTGGEEVSSLVGEYRADFAAGKVVIGVQRQEQGRAQQQRDEREKMDDLVLLINCAGALL